MNFLYYGFKLFGVIGLIFMPMVAQIILELDRRGAIHLFSWKEAETPSVEAIVETEDKLV